MKDIIIKTTKVLNSKKNFRKSINPYYSKKNFDNLDRKIFKLLKIKNLENKKITY